MTVADIKTELVSLLPRLRRFAIGLTGNVDQADELVQAGCLKALERSAQWQPGTSLASWMFRILQTTWIDERRTLERRNTVADTDAIERHAGDDGASRHAARDTLRDVEREIAALPEDQRAVLLLVCVEGLAYKEAAEVLDLPIGTVMSRLARARGRLADALQVHEE
jgi:RNA polymerase sigma-70 factor, ECF subfamily